MQPTIQAVRAIGAEFALRLYLPVVLTVGILSAVLLAVSIWLVTLSAWWLILLVVVSCWVFVGVVALVVAWVVISIVTPERTKTQKRQVKEFVDKLQRLADIVGTPKFILLFQIIRDMAKPRRDGFIASIGQDTSSLQRDFATIRDSFIARER